MAFNCGEQARFLASSPGQKPDPEFPLFSGTTECPPEALDRRGIEHHNGVGSFKARLQDVVRAEIAIEDPRLVNNEFRLDADPILWGQGLEVVGPTSASGVAGYPSPPICVGAVLATRSLRARNRLTRRGRSGR